MGNEGTRMGPLLVHPNNPRYFMNSATGEAVYLTGSHTWANLQERAYPATPLFDFTAYLDFLASHRHNFIRLWAWEHAAWMQFTDEKIVYRPHPFMRAGPGVALDGGLKFDLTRWSQGYFTRLRDRVLEAGRRGFYVSVMLFQGFSIEAKGQDPKGNPWDGHPFNGYNNVNGINGDPFGDGHGREVHTLAILPITQVQEAYVRQVVDTVNDLENVLYEISNESHAKSTEWQYHMIDFLHEYEAGKPNQHPVGMTFQYCARNPGTNADLFEGPAEWVSPNADADDPHNYRDDPPPADGRKVVISDTDHLWGIAGDDEVEAICQWVWKSFLRGLNPIFMDPYRDARTGEELDSRWDPVRRSMGQALSWARRLHLARAVPHGELTSTGYCLADPGVEYLLYQPGGGPFTVELEAGRYEFEWFRPLSGKVVKKGAVRAKGGRGGLTPPFAGDAVLHLVARK